MPAYIEPLALPYGVKLRPIMSSDYFSVRIVLVSCLLYVPFPAAVGLRLECNVILYGLRKTDQLLI